MALLQELSLTVRRYGSDEPLPEQIPLRAGPLSLVFEAGCLRRIRLGEHELLRRVYVAVRDQTWGTAPDEISNLRIDAGDDSFHITFDVRNRLSDVDFAWRGEINGEADGTIRFRMDGEALADFLRARIGFCVLPPMTVAGQPARISHVDGTVDEAPFPDTIAPQLVIDGTIKPVAPFEGMGSLTYEVTPGLWADIAFEGDIFEMEDQRNWTDASYKIYSTPLRIPFPVQVRTGDRVQQSITLRLQGDVPQVTRMDDAAPVITVSNKIVSILPELGLGMASHGEPLSAQEIARLRALKLAHLRVDLDLASADYAARLRQACAEAVALGVALEVALFVDPDGLGEVHALLDLLREMQPAIARWLVFDRNGMSSADLVEEARPDLYRYDAHAYVGGGTNVYFTELNRYRPDPAHMDLVAYSVNPQVHAFDNDSLMETPAAQAVTVQSATKLAMGKPVVVSPVTLRPRFNPHAAQGEEGGHELPSPVDVRQMALFTAAWMVASLKRLAESGAEAVTYFETTGWRGVMETEAGSPMPQRFASTPGGVFPVYHVLADAREFAGGEVLTVNPLQTPYVEALALRRDDRVRVLVTNLRPHAQEVTLRGLPASVSVTSLDEETFPQAVAEPEAYRAQPPQTLDTEDGALTWALPPYAVLRVDY